MRLHTLRLRAFGPFAEEQSIDFDHLAASGLFLLDGPTGAGKTTVLDAITFALYGPGDRAGDDRLHSHFAEPGVEPEVELEFSITGVRHRVIRSPEYLRPKQRGEGYTKQAAQVHLERYETGRWVSRSSNKAEVADMLSEVLGLTRDQFTQVVLLPQGEFAKFLKAGDDERRALLTKLFGTQFYDQITDELDRRQRDAGRGLDAAQQSVREAVAAASEAAGLAVEQRSELVQSSKADREAQFVEIERELTQAAVRTAVAAKAASEHREATQVALSRVESFAQRQSGARAAEHAQREHLECRPEGQIDALAAQVKAATKDAAELTHLVVKEGGLALAQQTLDELEHAATTNDAELTKLAARVGAVPKEWAELDAPLREAQGIASELATAEVQAAAVAQRIAAARTRDALLPQVDAARTARSAGVDAHQRATDEHQRLVELRLSGMAAELAAELVDGDPCGVCGSTSHPAPQAATEFAVSADDVAAAEVVRSATRTLREEVDEKLADAERNLAAAVAVAADATVQALAAEQASLGKTMAAADQASVVIATLNAQRTALEAERDGLATQHTALTAEAATLATRIRAQRDQIDGVTRELVDARGPFDSVADRRAALVADAEQAGVLITQLTEWQREADRLSDAAQVLHSALAEAAATAGVEPDTDAEAPLADLRLAMRDAIAAAEDALAVAELARKAAERFANTRAQVTAAQQELDAYDDDVAPVIYLAKLAKGMAGSRRTALTTYVLRHWFEQVVQAANIRLAAMSSGRYELVRVDEGATASARAGLTLEVIDRHTGENRSPRSLSGGETFYTSLALALGLADVVKAEAGGVDLDTLFIDEGFGSLDADTLDQVMSVIDDLRDRGRVVGIVSHVSELKDRIAERVEVRRLPDGSSTLRVVA